MEIQVGDRVRFKDRGLPRRTMHIGWEPMADAEPSPLERDYTEHFGGLPGVVDVVDPTNGTVRVRGYDRDDAEFTVWIEARHLEVTRAAMDFSEETGHGA